MSDWFIPESGECAYCLICHECGTCGLSVCIKDENYLSEYKEPTYWINDKFEEKKMKEEVEIYTCDYAGCGKRVAINKTNPQYGNSPLSGWITIEQKKDIFSDGFKFTCCSMDCCIKKLQTRYEL